MLNEGEQQGFQWHNDLAPFERAYWTRRAEGQAPKDAWIAYRAWLSHALEERNAQDGLIGPAEELPSDAPLDAMAMVMAVAHLMRDEFPKLALSVREVRLLAIYLGGLHGLAVTGASSNASMLEEFKRIRGFLWRGDLIELRPALARHAERMQGRR